MKKILVGFMPLFLLLLLQGCEESSKTTDASKGNVANVTQVTKEEVVAARALERMNALVEMDWKKAYGFLPPGKRKILPYKVFANRMGLAAIERRGAEVKSVNCAEEVCDVVLEVAFIYLGGVVDAMKGKQRTSQVREKWIFSDGNWWYAGE